MSPITGKEMAQKLDVAGLYKGRVFEGGETSSSMGGASRR